MAKFILSIIAFIITSALQSQTSGTENKGNVFGQIFTGFRYGLNNNYKPRASFDFNQGILGYSHQLNSKIGGKIMYDVTRTTHLYGIYDTSGNSLSYSYFEGSKYTAYLKMAEIKWDISEFLTLRAGQLLNTQYLTFQDRFWGYRYVDVTFQEKYRLGMPADFGIQADLKYKDKIINQVSVVNGEGPFRYQDDGGKFIFSNNIQYYPVKNLTLKLYTDYSQKPDTGNNLRDKYIIAGFAGYKSQKYRIGGEYIYISNWQYDSEQSINGMSFFGSLVMIPKVSFIVRYDYVFFDLANSTKDINYYIAGIHYEPHENFFLSANFRYYEPDDLPMIYMNLGIFL